MPFPMTGTQILSDKPARAIPVFAAVDLLGLVWPSERQHEPLPRGEGRG